MTLAYRVALIVAPLKPTPNSNWFNAFLNYLEAHQAAFSLLFAFIVALSTVFYVVLTRNLVLETKQLRRVETEPNLSLYLTPNSRSEAMLDLVIQNTGRVEARNIHWTFATDQAQLAENLRTRDALVLPEISLFKQGIHSLAPGQQIQSFFGASWALLQDPPLGPVELTARYEYGRNTAGRASFILNPEEYRGVVWISETPMEKSLESISKSLESVISSRSSKAAAMLHVATATEQRLEQELSAWAARVRGKQSASANLIARVRSVFTRRHRR